MININVRYFVLLYILLIRLWLMQAFLYGVFCFLHLSTVCGTINATTPHLPTWTAWTGNENTPPLSPPSPPFSSVIFRFFLFLFYILPSYPTYLQYLVR